MEPESSFPRSQVLNSCSILSQIDKVHAQTTHFPKIHYPKTYTRFKQVVSLHQVSLPKHSNYDVTNPKINTRIKIF